METKNKPATPLPLVPANDHPECPTIFYVRPQGTPRHSMSEVACLYAQETDADAAYIAHTANAYPRLVEALKAKEAALNEAEILLRSYHMNLSGAAALRCFNAFENAKAAKNDSRALLRELGAI